MIEQKIWDYLRSITLFFKILFYTENSTLLTPLHAIPNCSPAIPTLLSKPTMSDNNHFLTSTSSLSLISLQNPVGGGKRTSWNGICRSGCQLGQRNKHKKFILLFGKEMTYYTMLYFTLLTCFQMLPWQILREHPLQSPARVTEVNSVLKYLWNSQCASQTGIDHVNRNQFYCLSRTLS